jgi:hypothetical protein
MREANDSVSARTVRAACWSVITAVVVQFYTAGVGVFGAASFNAHAILGNAIPVVALVLLISVLLARRGPRAGLLAGILLLLTIAQPVLVFVVKPGYPFVAAIHPVVGLAIALIAWRILAILRPAAR